MLTHNAWGVTHHKNIGSKHFGSCSVLGVAAELALFGVNLSAVLYTVQRRRKVL